jgi:hypothetical protein
MLEWGEFAVEAPEIAGVFERRHTATGNLCMLATLRADGYPRISPLEPRIFEERLVMVGMPGTTKFVDLGRDPRFCLHTATVDTQVKEGDAKVWGVVENVQDREFHARFLQFLFDESGFDIRDEVFDPFYVGRVTSASSIGFEDGKLTVTIWKPGEGERKMVKD